MDDLYRDYILEHYRRPHNFGILEHPDARYEGANPLCGDRITMMLGIRDGVVSEVAFSGRGCAISQASASLLTDEIKGKTVAEVAAMNTTLLALDGEAVRTFAYNCTDTTAGGGSYVDVIRPLFLAARGGEDRIAKDIAGLDPMLVPSWAAENVAGGQLVAFAQQAEDAGGLAVFQFHGIGGQWISVSREAHRELLAWLAARRQGVWTGTFRQVMAHVTAEQQRRAAR